MKFNVPTIEATIQSGEHRITPHSFRHWFATRVLATTGDLAATQDLLGHSSPATTRVYARVSAERLRAAHASVFGAERSAPADPDAPPPLLDTSEQ